MSVSTRLLGGHRGVLEPEQDLPHHRFPMYNTDFAKYTAISNFYKDLLKGIKSNDKLLAVEAQRLLKLGKFPGKPS